MYNAVVERCRRPMNLRSSNNINLIKTHKSQAIRQHLLEKQTNLTNKSKQNSSSLAHRNNALVTNSGSVGQKRSRPNELTKLSQDEGIQILLHTLPQGHRSRRVASLQASNNMNVTGKRYGHNSKIVRCSRIVEKRDSLKGKEIFPSQSTHTQQNLLSEEDKLLIQPCNPDDLDKSVVALEKLGQLPKHVLDTLFSHSSRYFLQSPISPGLSDKENDPISSSSSVALNDNLSYELHRRAHRMSDCNVSLKQLSTTSIALAVSTLHAMTNTFKDVLIRTYSGGIVNIILNYSSISRITATLTLNSIQELIQTLSNLSTDSSCRVAMLSGLGSFFCNGLDLTCLSLSNKEKQKQSAVSLAHAVKQLVRTLVSFPKLLVAAVNGPAHGLGVTILPLFDLVFAADHSTFSSCYSQLGQIPEGFATVVFPAVANILAINEFFLLDKTLTAEEAQRIGLVSSVVWHENFMENIIPRVKVVERMSQVGVEMNKAAVKSQLNQLILDKEVSQTNQLIENWTSDTFRQNIRIYLRSKLP